MEIVAFVNAMNTKGVSNKERIALLRKATDKHQDLYKGAMCGQGVDRHLFALYVASVWREKPSDFLKEVLNFKWALSTSQTPYNQTNAWDLKNNPNKVSAGGGFGPVSDDGYGVSYIIGGEDTISFHVASKKSSDVTVSYGRGGWGGGTSQMYPNLMLVVSPCSRPRALATTLSRRWP